MLQALDEALTEKIAIQTRFERDFERLRTVNTDREQQLLDDFEWKLREVEQACKRRLEDKEKSAKQRIKDAEDKLKAAENDLAQVQWAFNIIKYINVVAYAFKVTLTSTLESKNFG